MPAALRVSMLVLLVALAVVVPVALAVWGFTGFRLPTAHAAIPDRDQLLSDPLIRQWLHQLSQEEREVDVLERQDPAIPTRPGESLADERAQARSTWTCLRNAWVAAGGRQEECPAYDRYHAAPPAGPSSPP
jgi:hypothetical protein